MDLGGEEGTGQLFETFGGADNGGSAPPRTKAAGSRWCCCFPSSSSSSSAASSSRYTAVSNDAVGSGLDDEEDLEAPEVWVGVRNLDEFYARMYAFYKGQGMWCILASKITNLVTVGFTVIFSTFFISFVDWHLLLTCHDESSCKPFDAYVTQRPLLNPVGMDYFVFGFDAVLALYWLWSFISFLGTIHPTYEVSPSRVKYRGLHGVMLYQYRDYIYTRAREYMYLVYRPDLLLCLSHGAIF